MGWEGKGREGKGREAIPGTMQPYDLCFSLGSQVSLAE
jgi:hypothetical protein